MSPSRTLSRKFRQELQTTPGKWIQEKRLEMARTLLEATRLTVSEICYRVGYQDLASFGRLFAKGTGMPPAVSRSGIRLQAKTEPSKKIDVLILLAGAGNASSYGL